VKEYTTDGRGKEMIFYLISNDMNDMFEKVEKMKDKFFPLLQLNFKDDWTPLHFAIQHGSGERIIEILLNLGVDPLFKPDSEDYNALVFALIGGQLDEAKKILDFLRKNGENININDVIKKLADLDDSEEYIEELKLILESYAIPESDLNQVFYEAQMEDEHVRPDEISTLTGQINSLGLSTLNDSD